MRCVEDFLSVFSYVCNTHVFFIFPGLMRAAKQGASACVCDCPSHFESFWAIFPVDALFRPGRVRVHLNNYFRYAAKQIAGLCSDTAGEQTGPLVGLQKCRAGFVRACQSRLRHIYICMVLRKETPKDVSRAKKVDARRLHLLLSLCE